MSARSLNKVMLIGNLTRDPELRYTPSGTAVCTFGIATNRSWTPADGSETQEETEFHRIVAWAKLAEICSNLLYKGRKVYVEGRLQTRRWTGQDGQERSTTEVVIDEMIALGTPKTGGEVEYDVDGAAASDFVGEPSEAVMEQGESQAQSGETEAIEEELKAAEEEPKEKEKATKKKVAETKEVQADDIPF